MPKAYILICQETDSSGVPCAKPRILASTFNAGVARDAWEPFRAASEREDEAARGSLAIEGKRTYAFDGAGDLCAEALTQATATAETTGSAILDALL